jgi:hypothetical protein
VERERDSQGEEPALPPAGWYPDPENEEAERYWDGAEWTEHRHEVRSGWYPDPENPEIERYWDGEQWTDLRHSEHASGPPDGIVWGAGVLLLLLALGLSADYSDDAIGEWLAWGVGALGIPLAAGVAMWSAYVRFADRRQPLWSPWIVLIAAGISLAVSPYIPS